MNPILIANLAVLGARFQTRVLRAEYRLAFRMAGRMTPERYRARLERNSARVDHMSTAVVNGLDKGAKATGVGTVPSVLTLGAGSLGKARKLGRFSKLAVRAGKAREMKNKAGMVKAARQALAAVPQPANGVEATVPALPRAEDGQRPARVDPTVIEGEVLPRPQLDRDARPVGGGFHQATPARAIGQRAADHGQPSDPHIDHRFLAQIQADFPEQAGLTTEELNHTPDPSPQLQPVARRTLPRQVTGQGARARPSRRLAGVK